MDIYTQDLAHVRSWNSKHATPTSSLSIPKKTAEHLQKSYESLQLHCILQVSFCAGSLQFVQAAATTRSAMDESGEPGANTSAPGESEEPSASLVSTGVWKMG